MLIVAGEASADFHGANLVSAMTEKDPQISFAGIGGTRMENAGVRTLVSSSEMAVVGITEVFSRFHTITRAYLRLKSILKNSRPDLLILIDYPEFNLFLARRAKRYNVPVLYYICPQVWAWRKGRVRKLAKRVDRLAVILPFEADYYRSKGLEVEYVGHPLLDSAPPPPDRNRCIKDLGFEDNHPVLGLLPGSRIEEVTHLLPPMIRAAEILSRQYPKLACVIPLAPTISRDLVLSLVKDSPVKVKISEGDIQKPLSLCDLAFVASGTATLETAIMAVPMVIVYRISPVSYWIARRVVDVTTIGLVNHIAGKQIVPELIQENLTPGKLAEEGLSLLQGGESRENMIQNLEQVRTLLGRGGASERTAEIALQMLSNT